MEETSLGYNIRWLLRMIAKKGLPFLLRLYLHQCQATAIRPNWLRLLSERLRLASKGSTLRLLAAGNNISGSTKESNIVCRRQDIESLPEILTER